MASIETPSYRVIEKSGFIEIREYAPTIVAEVTVSGDRSAAANQGFRKLADFIFGNNVPARAIAMTAPVAQQQSQKIAMTAPVGQQKSGDLWKVRFTMPSTYTLETLPKPNNTEVVILQTPAKRVAAIRFSGFWSKNNLMRHQADLEKFIKEKNLQRIGDPIYAFYNPPWTLPMFRRNEVLYDLEVV